MQRAHIFVSGRVQGVFYRAFTEHAARVLDLTGWVRNMKDGRVEIAVEGEKEKISAFIEKLKHGPIAAHVEEVQIIWQQYKGEFDRFERK